MTAQDSTHVIRMKDIMPKERFLAKFKGEVAFAPHYSPELGAGIAFAYSFPANVKFIGDIASQGYALFGITGNHNVGRRGWNVDYTVSYASIPADCWGLGYDAASNDGNRVSFDKRRFFSRVQVMKSVGKNFYFGPEILWEWVKWKNVPDGKTGAFGYGALAVYDTRTSRHSPSGGLFIRFSQQNYTGFSSKPFYGTSLQFDAYREVWAGGVLALDILGQFTYGSVPWTMLPTIGGTERMRGYYRGRYTDNNAVSGQLELRQHIWEIFGAAFWVGGANVWGKACSFDLRNSLPEVGAGLRFKLQGGVLFRLDFGFGRNGQNGFVIGLGEAF